MRGLQRTVNTYKGVGVGVRVEWGGVAWGGVAWGELEDDGYDGFPDQSILFCVPIETTDSTQFLHTSKTGGCKWYTISRIPCPQEMLPSGGSGFRKLIIIIRIGSYLS